MKSVIKYIWTVICRLTYVFICLITTPIVGILIIINPLLWSVTGKEMMVFDLLDKIDAWIKKILGIKIKF